MNITDQYIKRRTELRNTEAPNQSLINMIFRKHKPILSEDSYSKEKWTIERGVRYSELDGVRSIIATGTAGSEDRYKPITTEELNYIYIHGESTYYTRYIKHRDKLLQSDTGNS